MSSNNNNNNDNGTGNKSDEKTVARPPPPMLALHRDHSASVRTGFTVMDEDVPVLEIQATPPLEMMRRGNRGPPPQQAQESRHMPIQQQQPSPAASRRMQDEHRISRSYEGTFGRSSKVRGDDASSVSSRDYPDSNPGDQSSTTWTEPSDRSSTFRGNRSLSFSLNKDYDEERLDDITADQAGDKAIHVAELLVGVVANLNEVTDPSDYEDSSIFESFFDLTHARLQHIFKMFDELSTEKEKGVLNYENFRRSLRDAGLEIKDKQSFERLVQKVDLDMDGGITFNEFETVVQSLKMAHMFKSHSKLWERSFRCINYNSKRAMEETIMSHNLKNFMYAPRPEWAICRWIELFLPAIFTLKCLSIKYRLHPLALEDTLKDEHRMRAKVDRYDTHLFVVFPVLTLVYGDDVDEEEPSQSPMSPNTMYKKTRSTAQRRYLSGAKYGSIGDGSGGVREPLIRGKSKSFPRRHKSGDAFSEHSDQSNDSEEHSIVMVPKVAKFNAYMFLSRPEFRTVITVVNDDLRDVFKRVRRELDVSYSRLRTHDGVYLMYTMLDVIVDSYTPLVEELDSIFGELSKLVRSKGSKLIHGKQEQVFSNAYHDMIRELNNLKRWIFPAQRVIANLILEELLDSDCRIYLRDVHDHLEQISDDINSILNGMKTLKEEYDHNIEVRMNGTMNALTIIATALLPGQFLSSVFGMNFEDMPELHWKYGYPLFWILTFSSWAALYTYFKSRGWVV